MAKQPRVFLAIGHGGKDPGAVGVAGIREKDVNLVIGLACRTELVRHGVEVGMSRTKDEDDKTAVAECNAFNPDYAADIHNNAGGGDGCEIYHHGGGKSKTLAQNVLDSIVKETGQNSRGLKTKKNVLGKDYYAFIRNTKCPAIIIECAFLDNAKDVQIIDTSMEQKDMGKAIAKGILKELGIAWVEEKVTTTKKTYKVQVGAYTVKANAEAMVKKLKADGYDAIIV